MAKKASNSTQGAANSAPEKTKDGGSLAKRIIAAVIIIAVAVVIILVGNLTWKHTDGLTTGFKKMYVEVNGTRYITGAEVRLPYSGATRFNVGYISGGGGFTYGIYADEAQTFEYTVDGVECQFRGEYTDCFNVSADDNGLTITTSNDSIVTALQRRYGKESKIEAPETDGNKSYFNLLITSADEEQTVVISLILTQVEMEIDPPSIIF